MDLPVFCFANLCAQCGMANEPTLGSFHGKLPSYCGKAEVFKEPADAPMT